MDGARDSGESEGAKVTTHSAPITGSAIVPCCGRLVYQLPPKDMITFGKSPVTCSGGWH